LLQPAAAGAQILSLLLQQKKPITHMDHLLRRTADESTYYAPPPRKSLLRTTTNCYYRKPPDPQLYWPHLTAEAHSAALLQLTVLATSLRNSADKLSQRAVSRITRLPAFLRRLFNKYNQDPQGKDTRMTWWENMVVLCKTAQNKDKNWPDSHDETI